MTRLLVLGGSAFVGRALADDALARGWEVTTFNRGVTAAAYASDGEVTEPDTTGLTRLTGDRTDAAALSQLTTSSWDLVADTWSGAPAVVGELFTRHAAANATASSGLYTPGIPASSSGQLLAGAGVR